MPDTDAIKIEAKKYDNNDRWSCGTYLFAASISYDKNASGVS